MSVYDLRGWLRQAEECGQLRRIDGAHWNLEIGAASQVNYGGASPRALLFDNIVDYPAGMRVLTGSVCNPALLGMSLGLGRGLTDIELVEALRGGPSRWTETAQRYASVTVESGPVLQNVWQGDDIDLTAFPVPFWHAKDGGRYIGTGCAVVTCDVDTGQVNVGAYRVQLQDGGKRVSINIEAGKHGAQHVRRWFEKQGRAPIAVSLGQHPAILVAAGTEVSRAVCEFDYTGAMLEEPLETIRGECTGLPIPAESEIALEGWLHPGDTREEGPFGEWTGYYSGGIRPVLTVTVERVYARDDPILLGAPPGKPPHDYSYMRSVMKSAMITDALAGSGVPGITGVWAHEAGGGRSLLVVAMDQAYPGHSRQVGYLAAQHPASAYMNRFVVTVDSDIDPRSLDQVMWALCTRCEPQDDIDIMRRTWGSRVDPLYNGHGPTFNSRAVLDGCRPFDRLDDFPEVAEADPGELRAAAARWPELGS